MTGPFLPSRDAKNQVTRGRWDSLGMCRCDSDCRHDSVWGSPLFLDHTSYNLGTVGLKALLRFTDHALKGKRMEQITDIHVAALAQGEDGLD